MSAVCLPDFFISPALPTTPVSLPYGTAVTTSYSGTAPPIRTLTQQPINVQTHRDHNYIQSNSLHPPNMLQQRAPSNHQQQTFPIRTVSFHFFKKIHYLLIFPLRQKIVQLLKLHFFVCILKPSVRNY